MLATLSMYDWPETRGDVDAFWRDVAQELAARGIPAPETLCRARAEPDLWPDPGLVVGQTCGLPFVLGRCGAAVIVGRGSYGAEGCGPGSYRSALIVRRDDRATTLADTLGRRVAVNDWESQSGANALKLAALELADPGRPVFAEAVVTGAHRASARAVARGDADLAAIDAVAWDLFRRFEPDAAEGLRVLGWTAELPSLPFITSAALADRAGEIAQALDGAARAGGGRRGVPARVLAADHRDYAVIRDIQRRTAPVRLALGQPVE